MRHLIFQIIALILTGIFSTCSSSKEFNPKEIPDHMIFVKKTIAWQKSPYDDLQYMKNIEIEYNDSMLILTDDMLIIITGQYGLKPGDTLIMPYSGEFGINYEVLQNRNYRPFNDTVIKINNQEYIATPKAKFEWWPELFDKIKKPGKGKIIVSGP
jgi:hypothetical protein